MAARLAAAAALVAALAIAAGAFGAHALAGRLAARESALWETATRYLVYSSLAALAMALHVARSPGGSGALGTTMVLAGGGLFATTLYALALGGPRWLGAVTPVGGIAMILGLTLFAIAALRGVGPG